MPRPLRHGRPRCCWCDAPFRNQSDLGATEVVSEKDALLSDMLAALKAVHSNPRPAEGSRSHEDTWEQRYQRYLEAMCLAKDAIAQAEAAGIKAGG